MEPLVPIFIPMLRRVCIENFLLIKDLELEFGEGLNIISGETGTGKSMTISAVEFVMGRQGEFPEGTAVEVELEKDGEAVILRREIRGGRSRYFLNGRGTTARTVRELLEENVSLQGQNEFVKLLRSDFQRSVLDRFASLEELTGKVGTLYSNYLSLRRELDRLLSLKEEMLQKRDFLEFRLKEIEDVGLSPEQVEELRKRAEKLKDLEKIKKLMVEVLTHLYDGEPSAYGELGHALRALLRVSEIDSSLENEVEELSLMKERLLEIVESLRERDFELSQEEIDRINELLFKVQRLEKKYGKSYGEIVRESESIKRKLSESYTYEERIEELRESLRETKAELERLCRELSRRRRKAAKSLETRLSEVLKELNLERAQIKFEVTESEIGRYGSDRVRLLFSAHGTEPKPIEEVASGGELTRLFLALSLIEPPTSTYIFDEVDVGVSGETSVKLAKLLRKLSKKMQVIAITHSAPICAAGDVNFVTEKLYIGDIPYIRVRTLSPEEKVQEVARLIGTTTENTLRGAEDLMEMVRD